MAEHCPTCGIETEFRHDHQPDNTGLDDGPPLQRERRKPVPKQPEQLREIRARAWATRRAKYGAHGQR